MSGALTRHAARCGIIGVGCLAVVACGSMAAGDTPHSATTVTPSGLASAAFPADPNATSAGACEFRLAVAKVYVILYMAAPLHSCAAILASITSTVGSHGAATYANDLPAPTGPPRCTTATSLGTFDVYPYSGPAGIFVADAFCAGRATSTSSSSP